MTSRSRLVDDPDVRDDASDDERAARLALRDPRRGGGGERASRRRRRRRRRQRDRGGVERRSEQAIRLGFSPDVSGGEGEAEHARRCDGRGARAGREVGVRGRRGVETRRRVGFERRRVRRDCRRGGAPGGWVSAVRRERRLRFYVMRRASNQTPRGQRREKRIPDAAGSRRGARGFDPRGPGCVRAAHPAGS